MSHKQIHFRSEAREKVLRGATALADTVRVTLGPRSKCVLLEKKWGAPIVCNDGVTIAKEVDLKELTHKNPRFMESCSALEKERGPRSARGPPWVLLRALAFLQSPCPSPKRGLSALPGGIVGERKPGSFHII